MKRLWRILPSLGVATLMAAPVSALGTADTTHPPFDLEGFREVEVQSGIQVELVPGPFLVQQLTEPLPEDLDVRVEGDRLILGYKPFAWNHHRGNVRFRVGLPVLEALELSGGAGADVKGQVHSERLELNLSGGAQVRGDVATARLKVNLSGGSRAYLEGEVVALDLDASGGAGLASPNLRVQKAQLDLSGGATADLYLFAEAVVDASGGSQVRYGGSPRIEKHLSGGASVRGY